MSFSFSVCVLIRFRVLLLQISVDIVEEVSGQTLWKQVIVAVIKSELFHNFPIIRTELF